MHFVHRFYAVIVENNEVLFSDRVSMKTADVTMITKNWAEN